MTIDTVSAALTELNTAASGSPLQQLRARRDLLHAALQNAYDSHRGEGRAMKASEQREYDRGMHELDQLKARIAELESEERRAAAAAGALLANGQAGRTYSPSGWSVGAEPRTYTPGNTQVSYFKDLFLARHRADASAQDRLVRNDRERLEERALNTSAGTVGEFAPPLWLVEQFVKYARPGRKFADSLDPAPLPKGVSSINLPKITGGTTTAIQATQNSALSQTDMTSSSVTGSISTIGGKQVVSLQLLEQSGIPFDEVILQDLAADYAKQFDTQVINGSNAGGQLNGVYTYFNASGTVNVTWTQATPAVGGAGGLYSKIFSAASNIESNRFLPPDTIWMHPRRWNWILSSSDSSNRPLVVPAGVNELNAIGTADGVVAQGAVGMLGGLAVITDANIPTNTGAGTNQDPILVGVRSDLKLWESDLQMETFTASYADSAAVLFRCLGYSSVIPNRYTTSLAIVNGTGCVTPAF